MLWVCLVLLLPSEASQPDDLLRGPGSSPDLCYPCDGSVPLRYPSQGVADLAVVHGGSDPVGLVTIGLVRPAANKGCICYMVCL